MVKCLVTMLFVSAGLGPAYGSTVENLDNIRATVRDFAAREIVGDDENVKITVGRLDPRLRLAACSERLEAYFSAGTKTTGQTNIGVRCAGPKAWSLFVPLTVDRLVRVAVALAALPRGRIVTAQDVNYELRSLTAIGQSYFAPNEDLIGQITTRPIMAKSPFTHNMVKAPRLVRRGERIVLSLHTGSVAVRVAGEALSDGTRGQQIRVRNLSSKRIINGTVGDPGVVLVGRGANY
ncbi:MAG: flagella basal body P-ring formation protein FlgA [Gammaproteobacteria bacterium]